MTRRKIADRPLIPAAAVPAMSDRRYFILEEARQFKNGKIHRSELISQIR